MFILLSDQFRPKSYLKLIKKYIFSEGEQFPLRRFELFMDDGLAGHGSQFWLELYLLHFKFKTPFYILYNLSLL